MVDFSRLLLTAKILSRVKIFQVNSTGRISLQNKQAPAFTLKHVCLTKRLFFSFKLSNLAFKRPVGRLVTTVLRHRGGGHYTILLKIDTILAIFQLARSRPVRL